jgi:hypothetical protein
VQWCAAGPPASQPASQPARWPRPARHPARRPRRAPAPGRPHAAATRPARRTADTCLALPRPAAVYYYRTNYLLILCASFLLFLLRNLGALPGAALGVLALLCLNDPFASGLNDRLIKLVRRLHPPTAHRMRSASGAHSTLGARRGRGGIKVLGVPRKLFAAGVGGGAALLMYWSGALLTLAWAYLCGEPPGCCAGLLCCLPGRWGAHAGARAPWRPVLCRRLLMLLPTPYPWKARASAWRTPRCGRPTSRRG